MSSPPAGNKETGTGIVLTSRNTELILHSLDVPLDGFKSLTLQVLVASHRPTLALVEYLSLGIEV
jgi:hypothetical protein